MSMVPTPTPVFYEANGAPLQNGYIYIGTADMDPIANPIQVYWDEALTITATQPIRTLGGYPSYQGKPARLFVAAGSYSITVKNKSLITIISQATANWSFITVSDLASTASGKGVDLVAGAMRVYDPMDYGAAGDGTANDYAAFVAADVAAAAAGAPVTITKDHRLNTSYTTTADLVFVGGSIKPASGTTFTISTAISAAPVQIFDVSLGGTVTFTKQPPHGYPEWWGAVVGDTSARSANVTALNACAAACSKTMLLAGTYYTDAVWRASASYRSILGVGRDKTAISSNSATAHILHCGGTNGVSYQERPRLEGFTLVRTVAATVPASADDDAVQGHGLHMEMTSNATVREVDTSGNLVGVYWCNALSPLWEDGFDNMTGTGARCYSWMLDGTVDDGLGPAFPALIVFRGDKLRQSNSGSATLRRGMLVLGSYTDMQVDRVETAGVHNGLLCIGGGGNAHFNNHWHDAYLADGIMIDKSAASSTAVGAAAASSGENITIMDAYCAPGVGATGQPITLVECQNVQIIGAQVTSYPGGGNSKIGVLLDTCINCTFSGMVVNHSTGVKFDTCYGCTAEAGVVKLTGTADEGIYITGGYGNTAKPRIVGVTGSVGYSIGVRLVSTGGNTADLSGVIDSAVTNRLTLDATPEAGAGNITGQNFVIRPGATFATAST